MTDKPKLTELKLPDQVFRYRSAEEQLSSEFKKITPVEKFTWKRDEGVYQYLVGAEYPMKGLADQNTMWALNMAKRHLIEMIRVFTSWYFYPSIAVVALLPWKFKLKFIERLLQYYVELAWRPLSPFFLQIEYMTSVSQETEWVVYSFLVELGISKGICDKFAEIFGGIVEYDNAYRLRVLDVFSETTKRQIMEDPIGEVKRMSLIMQSREAYQDHVVHKIIPHRQVAYKAKLISRGLSLVLLHPKIRKAFKKAVSEIDVRKMQFDEIDKYWACLREDYLFFGKTLQERSDIIKDKGKPLEVPWQRS